MNLQINKDNYKGYVELYKSRTSFNDNSKKEIGNKWILTLIVFLLSATCLSFLAPPSMAFNITFFGGILTFGILIKIESSVLKKQCKKIKDKFPYIDLDVNTEELEKALQKVNILGSNKHMNIEAYEDYLKCEEIKEQVIEANKYASCECNFLIADDVINKVKVKRLVKNKN